MERPVVVATSIAPKSVHPARESESLSSTVASCTADCKQCVVFAIVQRLKEQDRLTRAEASEMHDLFERQAFGIQRARGEYMRTLSQKEDSLHRFAINIAGCDKATGGARLMTESMLADARAHMSELVKAERALYISDVDEGMHAAAAKEDPPFVPPAPWTAWQRFWRSFGIKT